MKNNNLKYNLYDDVKDVIKSCVVSIIPTVTDKRNSPFAQMPRKPYF